MADETTPTPSRRDQASLGEVFDYVKTYAQQETVGPLKGAARWVGLGAAGAIALGLGLSLILLGLLRMLQTESFGWSNPRWSWMNYVVVAVICLIALGLSVWRINKTYLNKEDKR